MPDEFNEEIPVHYDMARTGLTISYFASSACGPNGHFSLTRRDGATVARINHTGDEYEFMHLHHAPRFSIEHLDGHVMVEYIMIPEKKIVIGLGESADA